MIGIPQTFSSIGVRFPFHVQKKFNGTVLKFCEQCHSIDPCKAAQQDIRRHCSKICRNLSDRGKTPWNKGKGTKSSANELFRKSLAYIKWRVSVFERDDYTCQICKQKGGRLNADHIKPFAYFHKLRLSLENGRTLCESCHRKTDTYGWGAYHSKHKNI